MCIAPVAVPDVGLIGCRKCWQCRRNRVDDLVGRCIAESHMADQTLAVTLTYGGGDVVESAVLIYSDWQRFMKRLRKAGYNVRYIVAGEYGSARGRAHWHGILFIRGKRLPVAVDPAERKADELFFPRWKDDPAGRIAWAYWPAGFTWVEEPSYEAFRYVLKYALKGQKQDVEAGHLAMSKKPALGDEYFRQMARRWARQGLAPADLSYSFPGEFKKTGERRKFIMQGVTRENFLAEYVSAWDEYWPGRPMPYSVVVDEYTDGLVRWTKREQWDRDARELARKALGPWRPGQPLVVKALALAGYDVMLYRTELDELWAMGVGQYGERRWLKRCLSVSEALRLVRSGRRLKPLGGPGCAS